VDLNIDSVTADHVGFNIDYASRSGVTAAADLFGAKLNLVQADADGDLFGLQIGLAATSVTIAGTNLVDCFLCLTNAENQAAAVSDAIRVTSTSATNADITDGIDVSDANITNAINVGSNIILMNDVSFQDDSASANSIGLASGDNLTVISGAICVDNDGTCTSLTAGQVRADSFPTTGGDVAEMYRSDEALEAGDVVRVDPTQPDTVAKSASAYGAVMGVVSTEPGVILAANRAYDDETRGNDPSMYAIGLIGRVPVKVSLENGPIQPGDLLTTSSTPGVAMKATEAGQTLGIALEAYDGMPAGTGAGADGVGKVLCFVSVGERNTAQALRALQVEHDAMRRELNDLRAELHSSRQ
jgi:hypothetical protein